MANGPQLDAGSDAPRPPSGDAESDAPAADAGAESTCEKTRAFVLACGGELTCGADKFDAWCAANDSAINSEAFRRAEAKCLGDPAGCKTRATTYRSALGPASVTAIFVAAWELADPLCDTILEKCTGASGVGGADCAKAFAGCSADQDLAKLPDCP